MQFGETALPTFKQLISGDELIVAPVALNAIMARLAMESGFKAVYLSGGSLGWAKCVTEANLSLTELVDVALEMSAACPLPVVLDAGAGWGDPVHMHRTMALTEAAGIAAIEIEDQLLPRRVEHHVGVDHLVPTELVVDRIREAVAARRNPDTVIIGRTNARRVYDLDEAIRRGEALRKAGADMIFIHTRDPQELKTVAERLGGPLMSFAPPDGFSTFKYKQADLAKMGYRLMASSGTAFAAMYAAVRQSYQCLAGDTVDPFLGPGGAERMMKEAHKTSELPKLLEIERRTMKPK